MLLRKVFSMVIIPAVSAAASGILKLSLEQRRIGPAQKAGERIDRVLTRAHRQWSGGASHVRRRFGFAGLRALGILRHRQSH